MLKVLSVINSDHHQPGFSLVEAILAVAVLGMLVTIIAGALLYGQESAVLSGNRNRAVLLAEEGAEAVRNIRDENFSNLIDGSYGLTTTSNQYNLTPSSDTLDIYNRQIIISTINSFTKQATVNVTWQQNLQRSGLVTLVGYLTDWQRTLAALGGVLVYGDTTTSTKFRSYDSTLNTFSTESAIATNADGHTFVVRVSPISNEAIAGFVTPTGILNIMCYNGSNWSQEWTTTVGGTGTTRRFDIAYETATGDAMVLYSNNVANNNELGYRTKLGSAGCGSGNWSGNTNYSALRTNGIVQWVRLAWDRRAGQNLISALWTDANRDLSVVVWSGTAWGNEPSNASETNLEVVAGSTPDSEDFDLEYESLSGDLMLVWAISVGSNANGVRYRTCTGGTAVCTWSAITTPAGFADDATNLDLSANPNTDEMVFASIGNAQSDLQIGYWSSSTWFATQNADTSCNTPIAGSKLVATGWLIAGANTHSIIRYADQGSSAIDWYTGTGPSFNKENDTPVSPAANGPRYYDIQMNPLSEDQLMLLTADGANDLFAKRLTLDTADVLTWTDSDGAALETTLAQTINSPFAFAWWRN